MAICVGFVIDYVEILVSRLERLLSCLEIQGDSRGLIEGIKKSQGWRAIRKSRG